MRDWTLGPGDPLALTLAADFRLCTPDYVNDQIWELETGGGDPPALALRTTYGLRARAMRIFPRFSLGSQMVTDPAAFPLPPRLRRFYPNFLQLDFSPFPDIDVVAEYWVPDSHTTAGRFTVTNRAGRTLSLLLEICGQLAPLDGQSLAPLSMHSVNILAGRTSDLAPVIFLTGGPQPGPGPYPSLVLDLALAAGGSRSLTWVHAALANPSDSFELARRTAARPWEAEQARIELVNAAQTIEIHTGDPDWDAALALSQKTAFSLFFGPSPASPLPKLCHRPPAGPRLFATRGWQRLFPALERTIPSGGRLIWPVSCPAHRNWLPVWCATSWLHRLKKAQWIGNPAWPVSAGNGWLPRCSPVWPGKPTGAPSIMNFLREIQPGLNAFIQCWFTEEHDRDLDGFPEWDHPLQTGLEDNPAFTVWQAGGQGAGISAAESPALSAMLCREILSLAQDCRGAGSTGRMPAPGIEIRRTASPDRGVLGCTLPFSITTATGSPTAARLANPLPGSAAPGTLHHGQSFRQSVRLLVRIKLKG